MNEDRVYYVCKKCKGENDSPCKLTTNDAPGIPPVCPFDLGFEPDWKQVEEKEYNETK